MGLERYGDFKAFMDYSNDMQIFYENIEEQNQKKKHKLLIVYDDIIADIISNKKIYSIATGLFIRITKLNISIVFVLQFYFKVP